MNAYPIQIPPFLISIEEIKLFVKGSEKEEKPINECKWLEIPMLFVYNDFVCDSILFREVRL